MRDRRQQKQATKGLSPRTKALVLAVVAGLALAGGVEVWLVAPAAETNASLQSELDRLTADNARTEEMIADYEQFKRDADEVQRRFDEAIAAVPSEAELAAALDDLQRVTEATGVYLVRFSPGPAPTPRPAPAPGSPDAQQVPAVSARPIVAVVRSDFEGFRRLLVRLAEYPRLLTVEGFTMRPSTDQRFAVEASVSLNCYFKRTPVPPGAPGR
jgi:Tfp pilus assembly protein PilO